MPTESAVFMILFSVMTLVLKMSGPTEVKGLMNNCIIILCQK